MEFVRWHMPEFARVTRELRIAEMQRDELKALYLSHCQQMLMRYMSPEEFARAVACDAYSRIKTRYGGD